MQNSLHKTLITLTLLILFQINASAQSIFKAKDDNALVEVNSFTTAIDVLDNDYYADDAEFSDLTVTIITNPLHGMVSIDPITKNIIYTPDYGYSGPDQIVYQMSTTKNGGKASSATVYINVNDKSDVISNANCFVSPDGITFEIKELARTDISKYTINPLSPVIAGDIDNDGEIEIFVFNATNNSIAVHNKIVVFGFNKTTNKLYAKYEIPIVLNYFPFGSIAIAKITGGTANIKSTASLFFANTSTGVLYRYDLTTGANPIFQETWRTTFTTNPIYNPATPFIADLMGSGRQQIVIADKIFDANTGNLLTQATDAANNPLIPLTGVSSYSFGRFGHANYETSAVVADIDGDGKMEIIGGDCVYKVNLINFDTYVAGNTYKLHVRANKTGHSEIGDGGTAIADMDNDGQLDVIVAGPTGNNFAGAYGSVYAYNPRTGAVLHTNTITNIPRGSNQYGPSRPFVGDVDGDGLLEICLTGALVLKGYKYDPIGKTLTEKWSLPTTDGSSSTTLSMFDFAQDGNARLVYRDEDDLRIIRFQPNGSVSTEYTFNGVGSPTVNEYPIVIDVNDDGAAEILTVGTDQKFVGGVWNEKGTLRVYAAAGEKKWAPARKVWNQLAYNPVYVNNDLSIPQHPINPATPFYETKADGTKIKNRPFNNFLQQATSLNKEGTMIYLGADLAFNRSVSKRIKFDAAGNMHVTVGITNLGDATYAHPIVLQLYKYDKATDTYSKIGSTPYTYNNPAGLTNISPNNNILVSSENPSPADVPAYIIPASEVPSGWDDLHITINLSSAPNELPVFINGKECRDGLNNRASGLSLATSSFVFCENESKNIEVNPGPNFHTKWFDSFTGGTLVNEGNSFPVTYNYGTPVKYYFVEVYRSKTNPTPITSKRDTIFLYQSVDSLIWTGDDGDMDWNNPYNWKKSGSAKDLYPEANVPRKCTNVLIPATCTNYSDLADKGIDGRTSYDIYDNAECNNITFAFGGEIRNPDLLSYSKAYVNVTFNSHRWNMFAPPLKNFYTGDIYQNSPIPAIDNINAYTKFWARRNPQQYYYTVGWTSLFYNPDQTFETGQALGVWISDKIDYKPNPAPQNPFNFEFPKHDSKYNVYIEGTSTIAPNSPTYYVSRTNAHRFIFDGQTTNGSDFLLKADGETIKTGDMVLIGNPFLSHIDFDKLQAANSTKIRPYYIIIDENGASQQYLIGGGGTLSKNIAPMQGFLVEVINPFTHLTVNGSMTAIDPGKTLRRTTASINNEFNITINASQDGKPSSFSEIFFNNEYDNSYKVGEDIAGLYMTSNVNALSVYTRSKDGMKVSANFLNNNLSGFTDIPVGLHNAKQGKVRFNISNLNTVPESYSVYFYDKLTGQTFDLSTKSMIEFEIGNSDNEKFYDNRFYIRFEGNSQNNIINPSNNNELKVYSQNGNLTIEASTALGSVEVYNLQGQMVNKLDTKLNFANISLPQGQVYIIKVANENFTTIKKVFVNY